MKIVLFLLLALFLVTLANPTADVGDGGTPPEPSPRPSSSSVSKTEVGNLTKKTSEKTIQIKNQVRILPSSNRKI